MEDQSTHPHSPLNLAAANDIHSFDIDPSLEASSEFFAGVGIDEHDHEHEHDHNHNHQVTTHNDQVDDDEHGHPTQDDIDAVIKASLDHVQAQAQAQVAADAVAALTRIDTALPDSDDIPTQQEQGDAEDLNERPSKRAKTLLDDDQLGTEGNPIPNPTLHIAPFSKPDRQIGSTPLPLYLQFPNKGQFLRWLDAENSWCHFVQRRTTTPDKRSAERLQSRIRAHNKSMEAMTPEERAAAPPLKTRRRKRVSPVFEKVTFTCHHAGTYESKHSTSLPKEKLRLNTKKSVKCACASRVILIEMQSGDCKVVYHWRHEGHDPFSDTDIEGGRLPKSIDIWLTKQIEVGKSLDDIRKVLSIPEEEKEAYLAKVAADPTTLEPDMPPPLALVLKVKYPDIYNRYRKLKGPVKDHKVLKGSTKRTSSGTAKSGSRSKTNDSTISQSASPSSIVIDEQPEQSQSPSIDQQMIMELNSKPLVDSLDGLLPTSSTSSVHGVEQGGRAGGMIIDEHSEVDNEFAQLASSHDLLGQNDSDKRDETELDLIHSHEGLARALLDLPSAGPGLRDEDGNEMSLEEAMRRMAEGVAAVAAAQAEGEAEGEDQLGTVGDVEQDGDR
ncbi:hypothetical protein L486_00861 [Kwoniella mangroviensis CBS 10435]|uniref:Uncharacterized protein n=1 Tax=Kwoniella mangroviensis CBS 10435 TaxID=1331196 RepID=A0A1B9J0A1_9TREE|nr:hypothetical protein L486_00861 [Kwoniella mangroviensis CBS 10435]OCF77233.1 hypothetical protein I204_01219 [Kwoniella mangroviensis CBS 8886]